MYRIVIQVPGSMASLKSFVEHSYTPIALRSYAAEFISTFLFVFASVGSTMASHKMSPESASDPASLAVTATAKAFALSAAVYISANISGGHVNPAVTFGMAIGGHITVPMAILYGISQMSASALACLLLKITTVSSAVPIHSFPYEMTGFGAAMLEAVTTYGLVYTSFASADPRKGRSIAVGSLSVGFIYGANALASGPFTGGSMNPAYSFGAALVRGNFRDHGAYWAGPLVGAALAAITYDYLVFPAQLPDRRPDISDGDEV
ncbi:probable aquaporin TIP5-1 [Andrographis paniculata]|uniref:probable aquaporin TIP5-1 n=1 Tax=Andrographis paniculata TaxID=175694 RepID=UPI0021E84DE1|nr:probable aquaporin TIP5-1 [Andrographis paniculata]